MKQESSEITPLIGKSRIMDKLHEYFANRSVLVDFLVILLGISSWIAINGLWVEMPVLVQRLPEGWNLASYIVIIVQAANFGPLCYSLVRMIAPQKLIEKPAIHVTYAIGSIAGLLLTVLWHKTSYINGTEHSTALLTLSFSLAIVDCTTSVLYLPFMANFKEKYLISFLIGEGMSGLIPSVGALIQGVGGNQICTNITKNSTEHPFDFNYTTVAVPPTPRFSVSGFFGFLTVMLVFSWMAFGLLTVLPQAAEEMVPSEMVCSEPDSNGVVVLTSRRVRTSNDSHSPTNLKTNQFQGEKLSLTLLGSLLAIQTFVCCLTNGVLPAIQTYSCLPYGNVSYHLAVTLSSITNPIVCFLATFFPVSRLRVVCAYFISGTMCSVYILATAATSPYPPLHGTAGGSFLVIIAWIAFVGLMSFTKACIATILRQKGGQKPLFYCGVMTQVGSAIGSIVMFGLVNQANLFKSYNPCS